MAKKKKQNKSKEIPVNDPVNVKDPEVAEGANESTAKGEKPNPKNDKNGSKKDAMDRKSSNDGEVEIEFGPEEEVNKLKQESGEWKDKYQRLYAEFDNFRKRTQKEKLNLIGSANEDLMKALLPILDDFTRTMEAMEKTDNLTSIKDGVKMVSNNFSRILEKKGLAPLASQKGDEFNSEIHEAITTIPAGDEHAGKIFDITEPGYKLGDKVIRYARVVVGE